MKDWLEAVKEKLQEANSPLPDGELEILKGIIRRRKTKRILSWLQLCLRWRFWPLSSF